MAWIADKDIADRLARAFDNDRNARAGSDDEIQAWRRVFDECCLLIAVLNAAATPLEAEHMARAYKTSELFKDK